MLFSKGLEIKDIKVYSQEINKKKVNIIAYEMYRDYISKSNTERMNIEYRIKDVIVDIDKYGMLPIAFGFLPVVISNLTRNSYNSKLVEGIIYTILYIVTSFFIVKWIGYYRCCKLYLEVINNIKSGKYATEYNQQNDEDKSNDK